MLFDDIVRDTSYDLWVGDECWEIDYFLRENPERKIAPYVFMTDVIGFLPTDSGDPREAGLCAEGRDGTFLAAHGAVLELGSGVRMSTGNPGG